MAFLNSYYESELELEDFEVGVIIIIKSMTWNSVQLKKSSVPSPYAFCLCKNLFLPRKHETREACFRLLGSLIFASLKVCEMSSHKSLFLFS